MRPTYAPMLLAVILASLVPGAPGSVTAYLDGWSDRRGTLCAQTAPFESIGYVCSDGFGAAEAKAACNSLGFPDAVNPTPIPWAGSPRPSRVASVNCSNIGAAGTLQDCNVTLSPPVTCPGAAAVGVDCRAAQPIVVYTGVSKTPYRDFDFEAFAVILAKWLWVPRAAVEVRSVTAGEDLLANVRFSFQNVSGTNVSRVALDYYMLQVSHAELDGDLGLVLLRSNETDLPYLPPQNPADWRYAISMNGRLTVQPKTEKAQPWGTVCSKSGFSAEAALLACLSSNRPSYSATTFVTPEPTYDTFGPIYMSNVTCPATVNGTLGVGCTYDLAPRWAQDERSTCTHNDDVLVQCDDIPTTAWSFMVVPSAGRPGTGVVHAHPGGSEPWGPLCDDADTATMALQLCHASGFTSTVQARPLPGTPLVPGASPYLRLTKCARGAGLDNCTYQYSTQKLHAFSCAKSLTIECDTTQRTPSEWKFRLAGGALPTSGRVEMQPNSTATWGTVCGKGFTPMDALAACRSLGFGNATYGQPIPRYGGGTGIIYLDDVVCSTQTTYLQNCTSKFSADNTWTTCTHADDIGVDCGNSVEPTGARVITATTNTYSSRGDFIVAVTQALSTATDRMSVALVEPNEFNATLTDIVFTFTATNGSGRASRSQLETAFLAMSNQGRADLFQVVSVTSRSWNEVTPTPTAMPGRLTFTAVMKTGSVDVLNFINGIAGLAQVEYGRIKVYDVVVDPVSGFANVHFYVTAATTDDDITQEDISAKLAATPRRELTPLGIESLEGFPTPPHKSNSAVMIVGIATAGAVVIALVVVIAVRHARSKDAKKAAEQFYGGDTDYISMVDYRDQHQLVGPQ